MKRKWIVVLAGLFIFGIITFFVVFSTHSNSITTYDLSRVEISLERTPCLGSCPVYKVTIYGTGKVVSNGTNFVEKSGNYSSSISQDQVKILIDQINKIHYFNFKDNYTEMQVTDMPYSITTVNINDKKKEISHYHGAEAPEELEEFENLIDEIANTDQWIGNGIGS